MGAVAQEALQTIFPETNASDFEQDARLTAIWFWALKVTANSNGKWDSEPVENDNFEDELPEDEKGSTPKRIAGYAIEYDAARKLAQGLGVDLHKLSRLGGIISIKGSLATLNGVISRENHLIGQQLSLFKEDAPVYFVQKKREKKEVLAEMKSLGVRQPSLFGEEVVATRTEPSQPHLFALPSESSRLLIDRLLSGGQTTLDRLHQAMLLFGRSQISLLGPFLAETQMGANVRFWQLAQALSALYLPGSDEKRWVDGVLARKKSLGY